MVLVMVGVEVIVGVGVLGGVTVGVFVGKVVRENAPHKL